jgi:hypothetical protein
MPNLEPIKHHVIQEIVFLRKIMYLCNILTTDTSNLFKGKPFKGYPS